MIRRLRAAALLGLVAMPACAEPPAASEPPQETVPVRLPRVLGVRPHDPEAFTQGLLYHDGALWESIGRYGRSGLREVDPRTGAVRRQVALPAEQFGEGIARVGDRIVQLTWQEGVARVWRLPELEPLESLSYVGEGWGLASDGRRFVQSDGSAVLQFRALDDFHPLGRVVVRRAGRAVPYLNELEWVDGGIYANVWQSDEILRIDPETGRVTDVWDASNLLSPAERARVEVLNGIAWDPDREVFYLTGKLWPSLFEVELPRAAPDRDR